MSCQLLFICLHYHFWCGICGPVCYNLFLDNNNNSDDGVPRTPVLQTKDCPVCLVTTRVPCKQQIVVYSQLVEVKGINIHLSIPSFVKRQILF